MPSERERRAAEREENQNRLIGEEQLGSESEHDSESESEGDPPTQTNDDVLPEGYHQVMRDINAALKSKGDYARQVPKLIKHLKVDQFLVVKDVALGNKNSSECDAKVVAQLYKLPLMLELMFEFETRVKENRFNNTSKNLKQNKDIIYYLFEFIYCCKRLLSFCFPRNAASVHIIWFTNLLYEPSRRYSDRQFTASFAYRGSYLFANVWRASASI